MTMKSSKQDLVAVKTALAEKHMRLAQTCHSKPAKARLLRHAERFRQQAAAAGRAR